MFLFNCFCSVVNSNVMSLFLYLCSNVLIFLFKVTCTAVDLSLLACKLTLDNAKKVGVSDRIEILHNKLDDEGNFNGTLPFDKIELIVSNPPYIPTQQILGLEREVKV